MNTYFVDKNVIRQQRSFISLKYSQPGNHLTNKQLIKFRDRIIYYETKTLKQNKSRLIYPELNF